MGIIEDRPQSITVRLCVRQGKPAGKCLNLPTGDYYIGRGAECHIRPDSDWVSRQHCLLRVTDIGVFLRDLGSRNGTLLNGILMGCEQRLGQGDQIQFGPLIFEVQFGATAAALDDTLFQGSPSEENTAEQPALPPANG